MLTLADIQSRFPKAELLREEVIRFTDVVPALRFCYYLKHDRNGERDLLVVTNGIQNDNLAIQMIAAAESVRSRSDQLGKIQLPGSCDSKFTHFLFVPPSFHNYLRGRFDAQRSSLFLLLAICDFEFSGLEEEAVFREIRQSWNSAIDLERRCEPRVLFRFENPTTGSGTNGENFLAISSSYLANEVANLSGVRNGFLEIKNFRNVVARITSPADGEFEFTSPPSVPEQLVGVDRITNSIMQFLHE